jgi:endonuclease/exonuclease/phosphatase family metal-dependent hydrolase
LLALDRIYFRNVRVTRTAVHTRRPWSHLSDHVPLSVEVAL